MYHVYGFPFLKLYIALYIFTASPCPIAIPVSLIKLT